MGETEEYFPRGGKKPSGIIKKSYNFLGAPEKSEKKKKRPKKKAEGDDGYLSDDETREIDVAARNCAIGLSYKTIKQGVLVLARVRHVQETKAVVMLPCRMIGSIMACHVSEPYNKVLEAYVNDQSEEVPHLSKIFRPGQYILVKTLEVNGQSLMLSTMPQHVNGGKQHVDIVKGALFQAAVSSVEDHGFVMDIGIANTTAFLAKKELNPELELVVGSVTWCSVKSVSVDSEKSVVALTTSLGALQGAVLKHKQKTPLLPGTAVEFTVDTPLDNGIEGTIFGDTTCYVQRQHVDKVKGKKPTLGQKIRARVLYVLPTRNCPFLTMKNIFETTFPDLEAEQKYKEGDIIESAQVVKISGRSVRLKLGGGAIGLLSLRRIQVDEDLADEEVLAKSYPLGSSHKVRVLCYNMSDYLYSVSDQAELVNERYFSLQQLSPGDLVPATVRTVSEKVLELDVGRVRGFVPQSHITETGLFVDPKKASTSKLPMKKFKVGQAVKARVLWVDRVKNTAAFTLKPSLLAEDLEPLTSYQQARRGRQYTGVVRYVRDYLLVSFFNNVVAFVPRWFVTRDPRAELAAAYHPGQVVRATVTSVRADEGKMTASFITEPHEIDENWQVRHISDRIKHGQNPDETSHKKRKTDQDDEPETNKQSKENKKKRKNDTESSQENMTTETVEEPSKKKKKKRSDTESSQENVASDSVDEHSKKIKKKRTDTETSQENTDTETRANRKKKNSVSEEESDAIEIDLPAEELLTPQEQGLLDMSDCSTIEDYKKRAAALKKCIDARARRIKHIDIKIESIEERGLTAKNKKYHTAMQSEKLTIIERTKKLLEALNVAQGKLKEMNCVKDDSYKEEQKKRKLEKAKLKKEAKKQQAEEKKAGKKADSKNKEGNKIRDIKVVESLEPALEVPSAKDFWSATTEAVANNVVEEESSSSEDESEEQPKKKRKKLTVAEKLSKAREEEERVRALEQRALDSEAQPRSVEQFERSALAHPASSQLWIAYMALHLQATELDKARAVARRALAAIPFREESERLNVWLALLNLEQRFGTKETQQKTLEDALQLNDPYKVHSSLLGILADTGKHQEMCSLVDLMLRKYKRTPDMYIQCGGACFRVGLVDKARQVMQKAIAVLEKKEHVHVLVQFALLERSHGGRERAEALFEQVLAVYPQRVDVCAVYVDMLLKTGDVEQVRQVMERMTAQKMPARKMKVLYKKWVEVEERNGSEAQVEAIKQRALDFIQKAKF